MRCEPYAPINLFDLTNSTLLYDLGLPGTTLMDRMRKLGIAHEQSIYALLFGECRTAALWMWSLVTFNWPCGTRAGAVSRC